MNKTFRFLTILLLLICLAPVRRQVAADMNAAYQTFLPMITDTGSFQYARIGPSYGRVLGVAQDPFEAGSVYAITYGSGMYKSTDYGENWFPISGGMPYLTLQSVAVDPVNRNTLYAGTYGDAAMPYCGVLKSTNGGASWSATGAMVNVWNGVAYNKPVVYALVVDPNNPNRIFAGTRMKGLPSPSLGGGGVFRSENGGATWTPVNSGLPYNDLYVYDLTVDPRNPGRVFAALHESGLYRSDNYGSSWRKVVGPPSAGRAIAVDPFNSATLYYGAMKNQSMYRSTNSGASWSLFGTNGWDVVVGGISPDPYHAGRLFTGVILSSTDMQLLRKGRASDAWSQVAALETWGRMAFVPGGQTAYVAVDKDGTYRTTDGGQSWQRSAKGLTGYSITGFTIVPNAPELMYAALYGRGIYASGDGGQSWTPANKGLQSWNILSLTMDPTNPAVQYLTTAESSVYFTPDGGVTWIALTGGYPTLADTGAAPRVPSPFENRPLPERDDLLENPDLPAPQANNAMAGFAPGNAVAVSPFDPSVVLVATVGRGISWLNQMSWNPSNVSTGTAYSILFDRWVYGRALAAVDGASGSVLASTDNGHTWSPSDSGLGGLTVTSLAQHPDMPSIFVAGTDAGVFFSNDGGSSWAPSGLDGQAVKAVRILAGEMLYYFAGTDSGAYYSENVPFYWHPLDPALENIGIQGITVGPDGLAAYFTTRLGGIVIAAPVE